MSEAKEVAHYILWRIYLTIGLFTTGSMLYFLKESEVETNTFLEITLLLLSFFGWPVVWGIAGGILFDVQ